MQNHPRSAFALMVVAGALSLTACDRLRPQPPTSPAARLVPLPSHPAVPQPVPEPTPAARDSQPTPATGQPSAQPSLVTGQGPLPGSPGSFAPLVHRVRPSVVSIFTASVEITGMQWGFRTPRERLSRGQGTGFIISADGEVLTNNHVVEGAQHIEVQLDDGRRYGASVLGRDPRLDVALLRIKASGITLTPAALGNSDALDVGDWVVAMGNPYGLAQTVTAGIVSAVGRTGHEVSLGEESFGNLLQTDASINPGNSGGPLLNLAGEVIGINVAIRREAQGLSFAIPINMAKVVVPQLREYGHVVRSWLGVAVNEVSEQMMETMRLPDAHGALVMEVEPHSPASASGILPGDVIRRFDGHEIRDSTQLPWLASSAGVGHRATVDLVREGHALTVEVTLAALPEVSEALAPGVPGMVPIPPPSAP